MNKHQYFILQCAKRGPFNTFLIYYSASDQFCMLTSHQSSNQGNKTEIKGMLVMTDRLVNFTPKPGTYSITLY